MMQRCVRRQSPPSRARSRQPSERRPRDPFLLGNDATQNALNGSPLHKETKHTRSKGRKIQKSIRVKSPRKLLKKKKLTRKKKNKSVSFTIVK